MHGSDTAFRAPMPDCVNASLGVCWEFQLAVQQQQIVKGLTALIASHAGCCC